MGKRFAGHITNEELQVLPSGAFTGTIEVIDDAKKAAEACEHLKTAEIIGFDTETRPSFKKGITNSVALLQLSTDEKAFLFRICKMSLPKAVTEILENPDIKKIGAAIRDDIRILQKCRRFTPKGFVDLQKMVNDYGIEELSVRKIGGIVLGIRISKAQRLSNWEAQTLTPAQQSYAATDAWACLETYRVLISGPKDPIVNKQTKESDPKHTL